MTETVCDRSGLRPRLVRRYSLRVGSGPPVRAAGMATVAEEMPEAYKDVADVVHDAGISTRVVQLRPLGVTTGC